MMCFYLYILKNLSFSFEIKWNTFSLRLAINSKNFCIEIIKIVIDIRFKYYFYLDLISVYNKKNNKELFNLIRLEKEVDK